MCYALVKKLDELGAALDVFDNVCWAAQCELVGLGTHIVAVTGAQEMSTALHLADPAAEPAIGEYLADRIVQRSRTAARDAVSGSLGRVWAGLRLSMGTKPQGGGWGATGMLIGCRCWCILQDGRTPLHVAVQLGHTAVVKELLRQSGGVDVNAVDLVALGTVRASRARANT